MPVIHIHISGAWIGVVPATKLGHIWPQFAQTIRAHDGRISCSSDTSVPARMCGDLCTSLRKMGFTLRGSKEALALAIAQGYKPTPAQASLPLERMARTDLERWAHAGLNVLLSVRGGSGLGPSKFDRPGLNRLYVRLSDGQGLTDNEWILLCKRIYKYRGQVGEPPK